MGIEEQLVSYEVICSRGLRESRRRALLVGFQSPKVVIRTFHRTYIVQDEQNSVESRAYVSDLRPVMVN